MQYKWYLIISESSQHAWISFYGQGAPGTNQKFQQNFWPVQSMMRLRSQDCNSKGHEV